MRIQQGFKSFTASRSLGVALLAGACLASSWAVSARAQEAAPKTDSVALEEVVVTAQKAA